MMKKVSNYLLMAIFLTGLSGLMQAGYAQKSEAAVKKLLKERDQEIKSTLGPKGTKYSPQQRQKLKDIINGNIDYQAMAKYALQDTYDSISPDKQKEFVDLFSTVIRDHSLNQLDIYRADITYGDIELDGDNAIVHTRAVRKDVRKSVIYKLHYNESGQWVVTDFTIDDVSTADSYRRQFQNIIRKKGFDSLLETLRKRASR